MTAPAPPSTPPGPAVPSTRRRRRTPDPVRQHLDWLQAGRAATATVRERGRVLGTIPGNPLQLDRVKTLRWWDSRQLKHDGTRRAAVSLAAEASHVRSFFRWAIQHDLVEVNAADWLPRVRTGTTRARPIPDADFRKALDCAIERGDLRMVRMLALAGLGGLRVAEVGAVQWEDLDHDNGVLMVRQGKGSKDRSVPLSPRLLELLGKPGTTGAVIGTTLPGKTVSKLMNDHLHALGIKFTAHKLRARYLTRVTATTGNLAVAKELAGHSSVSTTERYVVASSEAMRLAADAAGDLG